MGGAWERLIRSVKQNYERMQASRLPTQEVLESTLIEIENIVNSRPLTNIPIDNDDSPVLTPNHFLLRSANGMRSWVSLNDEPVLRSNWKQSQFQADVFWKYWVRDYLPTITRRTKWFNPVSPIKVGDVVIVVDPRFPRNCWPTGRVIATSPASDGQVRRATVQTASGGIYERPAVSLAVLDVGVTKNTLQQESTRIPGGVLTAPCRDVRPQQLLSHHTTDKPHPLPSEGSSRSNRDQSGRSECHVSSSDRSEAFDHYWWC
ncbi:uncharacterized protein LOC129725748 [Wyeomyia smithii]|uniref:uncharacterized protein LOC129725748 n=1 Tax=Wyeomyia smithii TaxID=174621 RepID=UPI002467CBF8|nr:uncharacterized protein LOC129725748 [Wyeomyia smithii]